MKKWLSMLFALTVILTGCNNDDDQADVDTLTPVEVKILNEESLPVGEKVQLQAKVTQGEKAVDDAQEVKFEVWESGLRDEGVMLEGKLTKDGVYVAEHEFEHDGVYYMFAHTTARGMHVMPKTKFVVGNPDMSKVLEDNSSNTMDHGEDHEDDNAEEGHNNH